MKTLRRFWRIQKACDALDFLSHVRFYKAATQEQKLSFELQELARPANGHTSDGPTFKAKDSF